MIRENTAKTELAFILGLLLQLRAERNADFLHKPSILLYRRAGRNLPSLVACILYHYNLQGGYVKGYRACKGW